MRLGLKVRGVTVEPLDTPMRFEVRRLQHAPETRTTHGPGATLPQGGHQVVKTPARGWAVGRGRLTRCHRHDIETCCGGTSAWADPGAVHLEGHAGRLADSDCATGQRYGVHRGAPEPPEDATGGPPPPSAGSTDSERTRLVVWHGHARSMLNGTVHRQRRSLGGREERAWSTPDDKEEMSTHDRAPQFYTFATPKRTGVGFTKWTSRSPRTGASCKAMLYHYDR